MRQVFLSLSALLMSSALGAQGVFNNVDKTGDAICPRVMLDKTQLEFKSQYGVNRADLAGKSYYQAGDQFFPQGTRKDVSAFTAYDEHGKPTSIASLKGKVVLVGLWSVRCDPSAKMLMEMSSIYGKRSQYGFDILAVDFDENQQGDQITPGLDLHVEGGWRAIQKFMITNKSFFESSSMPVYVPGIGKEGPSNFMDMVYSVPVLFVVDREGKLAQVHIGYKAGFVGQSLKQALMERPVAHAPQTAVPAPAAPAVPGTPAGGPGH